MKSILKYTVATAILLGAGTPGLPISITAYAQQGESTGDGLPPIPIEKLKKKRKGKEAVEAQDAEPQPEAEAPAAADAETPQKKDRRQERAVEKSNKRNERAAEQAVEEPRKKKERRQDQAVEEPRKKNERRQEQVVEEPRKKKDRRHEQAVEEPRKKKERRQEQVESAPPVESEPKVEQPQTAQPQAPQPETSEPQLAEPRSGDRKKRETATSEPAEQAPAVSSEAAKPENLVVEPINEQVKRAEQEQTTIVPDNISKSEREKLKAADRKRRERARDDRAELLGAAAVGAVIGALIPQLGGTVAADEGDRIVVRRDGQLYVRKDESALFRDNDSTIRYERMRGGLVREIVTRPNGVQIVSVRDPGGNVVRRMKILPNGQRIVLFDSMNDDGARRRYEQLPDYRVRIPRDRYIVSSRYADRRMLRDTFLAEPVYDAPQRYSLREIQENERVRGLVRRVDLDTVNFETGSAYVGISQVQLLGDIAGGMLDVISEAPDTVFLLEGHTDAVGSEISNLMLSDRRAESVARILIDAYGVPPENLVTQGYGEEYLKIPTDGPERENRRVTVRNITPLLEASSQQ